MVGSDKILEGAALKATGRLGVREKSHERIWGGVNLSSSVSNHQINQEKSGFPYTFRRQTADLVEQVCTEQNISLDALKPESRRKECFHVGLGMLLGYLVFTAKEEMNFDLIIK